jgi:N-acetylmuramoyl-L-alanine amidase
MSRITRFLVALAAVVAAAAGLFAAPATAGVAASTTVAKPLAGLVIAIDPGHQLGNSNPKFFAALNRTYFVGGTVPYKICNTSGTATNSGYREATYNFAVAQDLRASLIRLGATVVMTRYVNSWNTYGPCIRYRGQFGLAQHAVLKISIHADGAASWGHGFFVMEPAAIRRTCVTRPALMVLRSRQLGTSVITGMKRAGLLPSNYIAGATMISSDQGTLNCSSIPTVIVETLNMRSAGDAARAQSVAGRAKVAAGLLAGIRIFLHR